MNNFLAALTLHRLRNMGIVCDYGDKGKEFFIILEGKVDILVLDEEAIKLKPVSEKDTEQIVELRRAHKKEHAHGHGHSD